MEPKYRTIVQAALMILVLAFIVYQHDGRASEESIAQTEITH